MCPGLKSCTCGQCNQAVNSLSQIRQKRQLFPFLGSKYAGTRVRPRGRQHCTLTL